MSSAEPLREHTTLRVGGPAREFVTADTESAVIAAVSAADAAGTGVLILGGGSNLVVSDAGFDGQVIAVRTSGVAVSADQCGGAQVTVAAGEDWDSFVERAVGSGWVGVEALSGIPGSVGATPIQNVGAYGQQVSDTIASVRCWDRSSQEVRTFFASDCGFGYRSSRFKQEPDRWVVLEVVFQFPLGDLSTPIGYAELAQRLGVAEGARVPMTEVREAVLELRRGKGMVLDDADHDTWSAGSFFTNPIVAPSQVPDGSPAFPQPDGNVKVSAAWLIQNAGFPKGYGSGEATLSNRHVLALTNRGQATTADIITLATEVRDGVARRYGIRLEPEPTLVNCQLPA